MNLNNHSFFYRYLFISVFTPRQNEGYCHLFYFNNSIAEGLRRPQRLWLFIFFAKKFTLYSVGPI